MSAPSGAGLGPTVRGTVREQDGMSVVVIRDIVAVSVHGPCEVFLKSVRMAVLCDHCGMLR
ncbi:MAG: hypothetical protein VX874_24590 [Pseudomonadota bacterium]|nr:hypothetical protein [Pseudomonadota bacterium]